MCFNTLGQESSIIKTINTLMPSNQLFADLDTFQSFL